MRQFERLARLYQDGDADIRRLALHQMETDTLDFEADDCLAFLEAVASREGPVLAAQAHRTLRRLMPQNYALKYRLRQPPSTGKAGTWTEYNIDRAEIDKLKRLGLAKTQDFTQIQMDQFLRSALHLLSAPVGRLLDKLPRYTDGGKGHAITALSYLATPEAAHALEDVAGRGTQSARLAAGALGDMKTEPAFQVLTGLFAAAKDPELAGDIAAEFRNYPRQAARDLLIAAADAGAPPVKIGAAIALASFGKLGAAQDLLQLAREEAPVSRWAVDGLCRLADPSTINEISTLWTVAPDAWVRRLCIQAAGATRDRNAQSFIKKAMASPDPEQRAMAVESLIKVHVHEQELFDTAFKLVNDPHPEVAVNALLAVAPIDTGMVQHRLRQLVADANWLARRYAVWCMGYVQGPASLATLKHAIYHDGDERVVLGAVKALAKYESSENAELLVGVLRHQNKHVRLCAARVLAECKDKDVARKVFPRVAQSAAGELDARVRAALIRALSRLGDPSQYLLVGKALKDQAEEVVVAAIEGLDVLGSIDSITLVEPFLADARPAVRAQAALALWNQGEVRVAKRIAEGLDSQEESMVAGSLLALTEILASLRRLEDSSKYVLLFSELKANLKNSDFVSFASKMKDVRVESPQSQSRVFEAFEFRTVVDRTSPVPVPQNPASRSGDSSRSGDGSRAPEAPAPAEPPAPVTPPPPPPISKPMAAIESPESRSNVVPMAGPAGEDFERMQLEPLETSMTKGLAFLTEPLPVDDDEPAEPQKKPSELEVEDLLARVVKGEGRAVLSRLFEMAREDAGPGAHLLAAQVLMEVAPADPREREATMQRAAEELERAARQAPGRVEPHVRIAELLAERDRKRVYKHAASAVKVTLELLAKQLALAEDAIAGGKMEDAALLMGQLSRQLPLMGQANAIHGEILYRRGEHEAAVDQLQLAHVSDPSSIPLMLWLVRAAARAGKDGYARHLLLNLLERKDLDRETADKARALLKKLA